MEHEQKVVFLYICFKSYSLVYREVFLPHHELQVVDDDVVDIIQVDAMLHCVQHRPIENPSINCTVSKNNAWSSNICFCQTNNTKPKIIN